MAINMVVAFTNEDWFRTLRGFEDVQEVNHWATSDKSFRALQPGELFLFYLGRPHFAIVGGGIYAYSNILPLSLAWDSFKEKNGVLTYSDMRTRLMRLGNYNSDETRDFPINCRILTQPFFFEESDWIEAPQSVPQRLTVKTYNTESGDGRWLWEAVQERMSRKSVREQMPRVAEEVARYGSPQIVEPRMGQGTFRVMVAEEYHWRCAVTQERTLPVLEAAHIRPYSQGGQHEVSNGLLFRSDIHKLFDDGYVTVTPDHHFIVSPQIREEFENGREYYRHDGSEIFVPDSPELRPDPAALEWHNENVFKG